MKDLFREGAMDVDDVDEEEDREVVVVIRGRVGTTS